MEYINGWEAVSIMRKQEESQKIKRFYIISISALDDVDSKKNPLSSGVDKIILKPCTKSDLVNLFTKIK